MRILTATLFLLVFLYLAFPNAVIDTRSHNPEDAATYLLAADSLARGRGFGVEYADGFSPITNQGPLFPLLLTPVVRLFGFHFLAIKLWLLFLAFLVFAVSYFFFRQNLPSKGEALFALAFLVSSPVIFGLSHEVLSEIPFIAFLLLSTWMWGAVLRGKGGFLLRGTAIVLATSAFYARPIGLSILLGGWIFWLHPSCRNREVFKRLLFLTVCTGVLLFPWFYRSITLRTGGWLGESPFYFFFWKEPDVVMRTPITLADLVLRIRHNLTWGILPNMAVLLFPPLYVIYESLFCLVLSLPVAGWLFWRWWTTFRQSPRLIEGIIFIWVGTLLLFTHGFALRYIAPLFPFMILYAVDFARNHFSGKVRIALASFFLISSVSSSLIYAVDHQRNPYGTPIQKEYVAAGKWARKQIGRRATYFAPMPSRWQVLSRGKAYRAEPANVALVLRGEGPEYLLTFRDSDNIGRYDLKSVEFYNIRETLDVCGYVQDHPEAFTELYHNQLFTLYQRK